MLTLPEELARLEAKPRRPLAVYKNIPDVDAELAKEGFIPGPGPGGLNHQKRSLLAGLRRAGIFFRLEQGLGKSKVILDLFHTQKRTGKIRRGIIFCAALVATHDWKKEVAKHRPDLRVIFSPEKPEERRSSFMDQVLSGEFDIMVIDYPALQSIFTETVIFRGKSKMIPHEAAIAAVAALLDWAVLDECYFVKDQNTLRWAIMAQLMANVRFAYGSSGTLFDKDPSQIFPQALLLDGGDKFGKTAEAFHQIFSRKAHDPFSPRGWQWKFDDRRLDKFMLWLGAAAISYSVIECIDLPGLYRIAPPLVMTPEQKQLYKQLVKDASAAKKAGLREAVWIRLRRILSGFVPGLGGEVVPMDVSPKIDWILASVRRYGSEPWVVFYEYTESGRRIVDQLTAAGKRCGWLYSGQKDKLGVRKDWDAEKIDVLVVQNAVGAQSLELQRARRLVFFESPCSAIVRSQAERRIYRIGQTQESWIYDLWFKGSVEQEIVRRCHEGMSLHKTLMADRSWQDADLS